MTTPQPQYATLDAPIAALAAGLLPPERIPLSEWADRHMRLSSEASSQPGAWTSLSYQREPLDCMSPHSIYESVVLVWASQMSKTACFLVFLAYVIAEAPGPALNVQPNLNMADAFSKERLSPMFRDTPAVHGRVKPRRSRDSDSTIQHTSFLGGHLTIVGANSPAGLATRPIRYLIRDEMDRWEESAGAEGDPAALSEARTRTFWNRKILDASTPTLKGTLDEKGRYVPLSRIESSWLESDQRYYHVPCPHCGKKQRLVWSNVEWPKGKPLEAQYRCEHCRRLIAPHHKRWMVDHGEWIASRPGAAKAGFHLSELYSVWPKRDWGVLADEWVKCEGDIERRRVFINTSLAEWWDDTATGGIDERELMKRRENYSAATLPESVALLVAGCDLQEDRIEVSVWGFGLNDESWLIEHRVIPGNLETRQVWDDFDEFILRRWTHPWAGPMPLAAVAIDAGHRPDRVCPFADERRGRRVWAVKGDDGKRPPWPRKASRAKKGLVYVVGVNSLRSTIQARLRIVDGAGRMHFPATVELPYFEQLNSEFLHTDYRRGRPVRVWERRKGRRAEAWDCAVYALAAVFGLASQGVYVATEAARVEAMRKAPPTPEPPRPGRFAVRSKYMG